MKTTAYIIRHGATAYNLESPPRLQGRGVNQPLAPIGVRQSELTRDLLASRSFDACYCSPMERALQTASILCMTHRLEQHPVDALTECDVGRWEGLSWQQIADDYPDDYRNFMSDPAKKGYPGGETFADVYKRAVTAIDDLLERHLGQTILVIGHHVVSRTYLAGVMGLSPGEARRVTLKNCSISIVVRNAAETVVKTLNSYFHLQGAAAA